MQCFYCGHPESKVLETRAAEEGRTIRRRRECLTCNRRFTTLERVEEAPLIVRKKDGTLQAFDRHKLMSGLVKACEKRPIPLEQLEALVTALERDLRNRCEREVPTVQIGELVMERLRDVDEVAYVRFASVYRQFKDIGRFLEELEGLLARKN
ncbi:transcriptional regulator NrdR [Heliophilum fasciatum]|uniref:Transcriptional repressor NrdR n=1 Tax=Heliophilum fasciatum TaxID=35700 RepID=A0A4R2RF00_9FIRM|nr:transcriptional regulator NrdR [Heliophilum fasciatum]MCW2278866.1 transcriptional repressor NrdR [Heliophilum fasciatum]TCP62122.1 transcriptional repressor NrdR [Heliophilum fasciatum]